MLIAGATVIPPIVARLLTDSFKNVVILSTVLGALSGFVGIYLSYYVDVSSGATVVLVEAALFSIVMAYTSLKGQFSLAGRQRSSVPALNRGEPGSTD